MKRLHLFEWEDQPWLPVQLRSLITDLLQYQLNTWKVYQPIVPELNKLLDKMGSREFIDLCSGGGGPILQLLPLLSKQGMLAKVTLTDRYPDLDAFTHLCEATGGQVNFHAQPVDATSISHDMQGVRTLFSAFHHFKPETAQNILRNAVESRSAIGIFEFTERKLGNLLKMIFLSPFLVLFQTASVRPFKYSRLLWTYIIPLAPLLYAWDALVSHWRTYTPDELRAMIADLGEDTYQWEIGQRDLEPKELGITVTYLTGYPK
ncbi:MAG: hypothetical protein R8L53_08390 [Mariprofundales bacterium]